MFDVSPSQIERLDGLQLMTLLRKLLHAEAQASGIPLRSVAAPLQITIADGGEDARVQWSGGRGETDYFPCRLNVFQSKAMDPGPNGWKKEVWTKQSQRNGARRELNSAILTALEGHGAYVGFSSVPIAGDKLDRRLTAIKAGIQEAGGNPDDLACLALYDANRIAAWASQYPAVAVWLNEAQTGYSLGGFHTIEGWGARADFAGIERVEDLAARFSVVRNDAGASDVGNNLTSVQARERILEHIATPKRSVRIYGPSGVGKSRFVYELFRDRTSLQGAIGLATTIYCDHRSIGQAKLLQLIEFLAGSGAVAFVVVDECPKESATALAGIACATPSNLRLLTIDIDDRPVRHDSVLNISVARCDDALVEGIIRQRAMEADDTTVSYLKNLCGGFPRIAVLATDNHLGGLPVLRSVDDVVERVLEGSGVDSPEKLRAVECLSMFERIGVERDVSEELDLIAEQLARQTADEMYEHLASTSRQQLVERRGRYFLAQPLPIAAFLGARRIDLMRVKSVIRFVETAPKELVRSFLKRWRYFDHTRTAPIVAEALLAVDGCFGTLESLTTDYGAECLDALCHVVPDAAAATLSRVFGELSVDELKTATQSRRHLVWALEKLAFRRSSFRVAARLLMRLAAVESEDWGNNASGQFIQLYQLHLSGTEAEPTERFAVLDEGVTSGDRRIMGICFRAIDNTLSNSYFSRTGGAEEIGSQPPLSDWSPQTWDEHFSFYRRAFTTLRKIREADASFEDCYDKTVAGCLRNLLGEPLIADIETIISEIVGRRKIWLEGIEALGTWLYFDRQDHPAEFQQRIRTLYDKLLPTDPVHVALLYTKFWSSDLHDPDANYAEGGAAQLDFEYSSRKAREVAALIAQSTELVSRAVDEMATQELHSVYPFAHELGSRVEDPETVFKHALTVVERVSDLRGFPFVLGLLSGIDVQDVGAADRCAGLALAHGRLKAKAIEIHTALKITDARLREIVESVKTESLPAADCVYLSYGRGLDHFDGEQILPLLDELATNHGAPGLWTALEIFKMYQHGRPEFDPLLLAAAKAVLVLPKLLDQLRNAGQDGFLFESLLTTIATQGGLDPTFATAIALQLVRLCQDSDASKFNALAGHARNVVRLLVAQAPEALWEVLSRFVERATANERRRLHRLVSTKAESDWQAGALFGVPESICFAWADIDPTSRAPFICEFYPMFEHSKADGFAWHPAMTRLSVRYGNCVAFREALGVRLHVRMWSGSLVPHLQARAKPMEAWYDHEVHEVAEWARSMHLQLEATIRRAERSEEEDRLS